MKNTNESNDRGSTQDDETPVATAKIFFDNKGTIVGAFVAQAYQDGPPTGIFTPPDCGVHEVPLKGEWAGMTPYDIHTRYRIDLSDKKAPRLVLANQEDCGSGESNSSGSKREKSGKRKKS